MDRVLSEFPRQKLPISKKNKKWREQCVDALDIGGYFVSEHTRKSVRDKKINMDLYYGKVDKSEVVAVCNPTGLQELNIVPDNLQHYPLISPRVDILLGEEAKRRFDWKVMVTNPTAISMKESRLIEEVRNRVVSLIQNTAMNQQELEREMKKLQDYVSYDYQDMVEVVGTKILKHYWNEYQMHDIFNRGFFDGLVMGEEIYYSYVSNGEPILRKLNPLTVHTLRSGYSNKIEDSDIIAIEEYWSLGQVLDHFHDFLSPKDVDRVERWASGSKNNAKDPFVSEQPYEPIIGSIVAADGSEDFLIDTLQHTLQMNGASIGQPFDYSGNIRVLQVFWRSMRKMLKVRRLDEFGDWIEELMPENYIIRADEGETAETVYINEWWEGVKLGTDVYPYVRPKMEQYRKLNNPSVCFPGISGIIYSHNGQQAHSLVDRAKNVQYLYDVVHHRLNEALATNHGKLLEMDFASVPKGWDVKQWLTYAKKAKIVVRDSFKENTKGANVGTISGNMARGGHGVIDAEQGAFLQQHIAIMEYLRRQIGEITGITEQRLGNIANRETVGGVERSVAQSSHVTEYWFAQHEQAKIKAMEMFLETAKLALKGKNKKAQYILDDASIEILDLNPEVLLNADLGISLVSSVQSQELKQNIQQLAHAAMQNGAIQLSTLVDIYTDGSIATMRKRIKDGEDSIMQRQEQQQQQNMQLQQQQLQMQALKEHNNMLADMQKFTLNLDLENAKLSSKEQVELEKIQIEREKVNQQMLQFIQEQTNKLKMNQDDNNTDKYVADKRNTQRNT